MFFLEFGIAKAQAMPRGRIRHDFAAFIALFMLVVAGIMPSQC